LQEIKKKKYNMKRIIRLLLFVVVIIFLYMLFLSIKQGIRAKSTDDLTVIGQTDAYKNS
jgi:multidrug resistance efflux pump